jgi:hypothetical protein
MAKIIFGAIVVGGYYVVGGFLVYSLFRRYNGEGLQAHELAAVFADAIFADAWWRLPLKMAAAADVAHQVRVDYALVQRLT